eukprot:m.68329 g.68329  ORF g.68329 m.68329 type:complete len:57 (+) comp8505_c0_seq1:2309-2479(+)
MLIEHRRRIGKRTHDSGCMRHSDEKSFVVRIPCKQEFEQNNCTNTCMADLGVVCRT